MCARVFPDLSPFALAFQVELKAVLGRLRTLFRSTSLTATDLQALENSTTEARPAWRQLVRRLLLDFLLWAPGGHAIARETIALVSLPVFKS